ncbi:UNVERIFIED_CONTAM: hypothetical protein Sangu_3079500 [Sesamum angustifolium]|uniref:Retrotransposon Copia-like N-terminal domain-containing protein n=1 Tax=Sesamum angustifolium TaxID=2727405 RepID=A0AAW2K9M1_9LAMI
MMSSSTEVAIAPTTLVGTGNDVAVVWIQSLEVPAMIMVSAPFNGSNWLSWSQFVRIALEDRDNVASPVGTPQHKQWRIADYVVRTWILSTISKDIVNAFLYASSSPDLWMELEARYSECDGTLISAQFVMLLWSSRTGELTFDPEIEKTARRLRWETKQHTEEASTSYEDGKDITGIRRVLRRIRRRSHGYSSRKNDQ